MSPNELTPENFAFVHDVPLTIRAELDRRKISFRALMELNIGSVVALSRPAGENVDIYVDETYLGDGEILVNDAALSIRLADLGNSSGSDEA